MCGEDHIVKGVSVHVSNAAPKTDPTRAQPGFPRGAAPGRDKGQSPFGPGPAGYGGGAGMGLGAGAGQGWNQGPGGRCSNISKDILLFEEALKAKPVFKSFVFNVYLSFIIDSR